MSSECEDARQRQAMCGRRWQVLQATCFEVGSRAGREDLDVRMLGSGRPFVLELADALRRGAATEPAAGAAGAARGLPCWCGGSQAAGSAQKHPEGNQGACLILLCLSYCPCSHGLLQAGIQKHA